MQRLIKFRAYYLDEEEKAVHTKPYAEWGVDWLNCDLEYVMKSDDYAVVQYTGLKDKNGTEIYEGDRLEYQPDNYDDYTSQDRYTVEWRDRGFVGVWDGDNEYSNRDNDGLIDSHVDIVVIGNIYDNPELLK